MQISNEDVLAERRPLIVATAVIGIGLSGFFDGILLHQILRWHHLLSLVEDDRLRDLPNQILADGIFHILMYGVVFAGLWLLWRQRRILPKQSARVVIEGALLGFGLWNLTDVVLFHWVMGIHRVRVDTPVPMAYDLTWLALLGIVPIWVAVLISKRRNKRAHRGGTPAALMIVALTVAAGAFAARPQPGSTSTLILFRPDVPLSNAYNAVLATGGRIRFVDGKRKIMVADLNAGAESRLYRSGALFVTASPAIAGCALSFK